MRDEYEDLEKALIMVEDARSCIAQNRGPDKDLARESYDAAIADELAPAMTKAMELLIGDLDVRDVERLGRHLLKISLKVRG